MLFGTVLLSEGAVYVNEKWALIEGDKEGREGRTDKPHGLQNLQPVSQHWEGLFAGTEHFQPFFEQHKG